MVTYRPDQIAVFAKNAGWNGNDQVIAVAVAMAESSGDPEATHHNTWDDSTDYGLWQINSVHAALLAGKVWTDPQVNANMAFEVWKGSGWRAWSTYNNGAYLVHMPIALVGVNHPATDLPAVAASVPSAQQDGLMSITQLVTMLTDPKTWQRLGWFAGGTVLMVIGIRPLVKGMA